MWSRQKPDGVIEGWHGDGNSARTSLMYALWKAQGLTVRPWREDVRLGAVQAEGVVYVMVTADREWSGDIVFDKPRHALNMRLPFDYPRINQFPEWFTVTADATYEVRDVLSGKTTVLNGKRLGEGLPLKVTPDAPVCWTAQKKER